MSFPQNTPENFPSSRQLEGGFLSRLRHNTASRVFALTLASVPVSSAHASLNPQLDLRELLRPTILLPESSETNTETEGSGDEYMTNEELQAEYCKESDPGLQIYYCYMSRISFDIEDHEAFDALYQEYVETGGDLDSLLQVLQSSEKMPGFSDALIPTIITTVFDTHYFSSIIQTEMTVEEREYYNQSYLPTREVLFQKLPDLVTVFPSENAADMIPVNK